MVVWVIWAVTALGAIYVIAYVIGVYMGEAGN
jgi:hypothetical protein